VLIFRKEVAVYAAKKKRVRLSLCLLKLYTMETSGGSGGKVPPFLTALDGSGQLDALAASPIPTGLGAE
jgi:hypothetical protein